VTTFRACSSPAPTPVKPQPAPAILSQESVHTTLSITHHTRKRPSTGPRTTHGPHSLVVTVRHKESTALPKLWYVFLKTFQHSSRTNWLVSLLFKMFHVEHLNLTMERHPLCLLSVVLALEFRLRPWRFDRMHQTSSYHCTCFPTDPFTIIRQPFRVLHGFGCYVIKCLILKVTLHHACVLCPLLLDRLACCKLSWGGTVVETSSRREMLE
jgi:hypothetical protein